VFIRQLVHRGYLEQDVASYSVLRLTPAARPLLRGEERLTLAGRGSRRSR
jgi:ATP-dependent DNA helicase RecQ